MADLLCTAYLLIGYGFVVAVLAELTARVKRFRMDLALFLTLLVLLFAWPLFCREILAGRRHG